MFRQASLTRVIPVLLALAGTLSAADSLGRTAACRVVSVWNADCSGGTRTAWDDMVQEWYDAITNTTPIWGHGAQAYGRHGMTVNGNIVDSDFTQWGNDDGPGRPDAVDAFMVGLHGIDHDYDGRWTARVRVDEPGWGDCNSLQGHMALGDGDLEFLHLSSCFSMDEQDWWPLWSMTFNGLHQIDGFHGIMWISSGRADDYADFANDAFWGSIASAWIDNMFDVEVNDYFDQCPVARNVGASSGDASVRMSYERYNFVLPDPPGLGEDRTHRVRYVEGCDPKGKGAL